MKKKWLAISFLVFTLLTLPVFRFVPNVKADPDWLSGWQYRKSHVINSASGAGTNYQVKVKVYYKDVWKRYSNNPILEVGSSGEWDDEAVNFPYVIKVGSTYYLYYSGYGGTHNEIGLATSSDGKTFTKITDGINGTSKVLAVGSGGSWDNKYVWCPCVVYCPDKSPKWYMFYTGRDDATNTEEIGVATSDDGKNWTKYENNPILEHGGTGWRQKHLCHMDVVWDSDNNKWVMLVSGMDANDHETIGRYYCSDSDFPYTWTEDSSNPVINYGEQSGVDDYHVYHPKIYPSKVDGKWYVFYTAATGYSTGRTICYATTTSLYNGTFTKCSSNPVVSPSSNSYDDSQVITPQVHELIDNEYYMYYVGIPSSGSRSICLATSEDITATSDISGSSLSNDEVALNSHCRTDFGDVRFTGDDGTTELDYWMEEKVDSDYAIFWIEVKDDLSSASATIYVYYGKSDATTTSNGGNTFIFFDDFPGTSLDTNKWVVRQGDVSVADSQLKLTGGEATRGLIDGLTTISVGAALHLEAKGSTTTLDSHHFCSMRKSNDWSYRAGDIYGQATANVVDFETWDAGSYTKTDNAGVNSLDSWHEYIITWKSGESKIYQDDTLIATHTTNVPTVDNVIVFYEGKTSGEDVYIDWCFVRKFVDPEPSHGSWGNEETQETQEKSFTLTETIHATATHVLTEEKLFAMTPTASATSMPNIGIEKWLLFQTSPVTSVHFILTQEKQFTTTPTVSATSTLTWGIEKLLQFQTSPAATSQFTLLKEGFYTATELVNTLASYILGKETTLTVKEYVKTETAQANAAYTILLEKLFFQTATPAASALANMAKEATQVLHEFLETAHAQATLYKRLYTPTAEVNTALVLAAFAAAIAIVALSLTITKKE